MKRLLALGLLLCSFVASANAQSTGTVVLTCGSLPLAYTVGSSRPVTVDINGNSCISGTINASSSEKSTAAAPTYVEGTNNPLSGDLSGNLRVIDGQLHTDITSPQVAGTNRIGYTTDDPCTNLTKTNLAIATSSGTVQLVAPSGSTQVYVCSFSLIAAATAVVNLVGGTGATCTTGTPVAAIGSTTAAMSSGLSSLLGSSEKNIPSLSANSRAAHRS